MPTLMESEEAPLIKEAKVDLEKSVANSSWDELGSATDITARLSKQLKCFPTTDTPGFTVDVTQVNRRISFSLDIFKGILVFLMTMGHTLITLSPPNIRNTSTLATFVMNACASQCFGGFMIAFGYSCYGAYLKVDERSKGAAVRFQRVLRTCALPVCGAWVCSFAWAFLCFKVSVTKLTLVEILTFYKVFGNGPDFLLCFSINLAVTYILWEPITNRVQNVKQPYRQAVAVALLLCPIFLSFCVIHNCSGLKHYLNFFMPCRYRGLAFESPNLPALPYLFDFGLGVTAALAKEEWLGHLRPEGNSMIMPWSSASFWLLVSLIATIGFYITFTPLKNIFWDAQLGNVRVQTPWGWMIRGFDEGPSMLWLLSTVFPIQCWFVISFFMAKGSLASQCDQGPLCLFRWFTKALEHLGANVLFYLVVADVFLAGLFRANSFAPDQYPFDTMDAFGCTILILLMGGFIHYLAATARK